MPTETNDAGPKAPGTPAANELARRFHRVFAREDGAVCLAFLQQKFGFHRSSYRPNMSGKDMAFCEGLKEVMREIIYQRDFKVPAKDKTKPTTATNEEQDAR